MMKHIIISLTALITTASFGATIDMNAPKTITAKKIEYDVKSETIKTSGKTKIENKSGQRMTLVDSYISKTGDSISGDDIRLWLGPHVYVESDNFVRDGDKTVAHQATFTACNDCDQFGNAWQFDTTKIVHNQDTRMLKFYNLVMRTYDIPILWLPYYTMPDPGVKRKSGLLMPDFGSTNNMGTKVNIPLYIVLSDTHDITLTTSYLSRENPLFQLEHRLNAPYSEYRTNASWTRNRDGENRWHIFNDDVIELGEYARATVFLERASDKTYLQKYGFYGDQPYLDSGARLELFGRSGYVVADAHIFQELRTETGMYSTPSGNILPNIRGIYQTAPIFHETYAVFSADVLGISSSSARSQRLIGDARIISPWTLWGGNRLTLGLDTRYDLYNFHNTEMIDGTIYSGQKNRFLPSGYAEWGLPLIRAGRKWTNVIEPRARLTVVRHTDQNEFATNNDSAGAFLSDTTLFSDNRFSGLDLWENGTFADYGVRWSGFDDNGRVFEMFFGQTYDFDNRAATDPNSGFRNGASDYVGRMEYNNSKWFDISTRFRLERDSLALRHMETVGRIGTDKNYINAGHIWSRQFVDAQSPNIDINEISLGTGFQLTQRWSLAFNAIYNATFDRFQRHTGALYYNHPCYYFSFGYKRDNTSKEDYVGTTTLQFRFGISIDGQKY